MKKGDARRQSILSTAERLFFDKGYEATSVQDILDEMKLSKGGFYHHFESKLQLLEEICSMHAEFACAQGAQAAASAGDDPIAQLNALFRRGAFFGEENTKYLSLMMNTAYGGELSQLRERMRMMQIEKFAPVISDILTSGLEKHVFYFSYPDSVARLIIMLACDVTDEVATLLAHSTQEMTVMGEVMELLATYRTAAELILNAPHGSLELIDMKRVSDVIKSLYVLGGPGRAGTIFT